MNTPWGSSQSVEVIAPGIRFLSTASHGGIELSRERLAEMPAHLKTPTTFYQAGSTFFEEDCEYARVVLAFPQYFTPTQVKQADQSLRVIHPEIFAKEAAR